MWKALQMNSMNQVRSVLDESPEAACEPLWEHELEPALCCAVRLQCDASIIQLLIEHGANPKDSDMRGRTPLHLLDELDTPCHANLWENLLLQADGTPSFANQWDKLGFGVEDGLMCAPHGCSFSKMPWYDALIVEQTIQPTFNARELWHSRVKHLLDS